MEVLSNDPGEAQAARIVTLRAAGTVFWRFWSPRVMALGLIAAAGARMLVPGPGPDLWDLLAVLMVLSLVPLVEWSIHLLVLHAPPRSVGTISIDPGAGHREHHLHPASINLVLLRGVDAAVFQILNAGLVVVVVGGPMWLLAPAVVGPVLSGIVAAIAGLLHYEWSHFLFHTAYRPKSRYYRRLKSNHRLHHWRNEHYWLGVTGNAGDRLMGTYRRSRSEVPLSPTAKTLGHDPQVGRVGDR